MRVVFPAAFTLLAACASGPDQLAPRDDDCLTGQQADWALLETPPANAVQLIGLVSTKLANPPDQFEERWYSSGRDILYCRRHDWCTQEAWTLAPSGSTWSVVDQKSWVCVTTNDNSFRPTSLRGPA